MIGQGSNHPAKITTMVEQETLWEGLAEGRFERFNIVLLNGLNDLLKYFTSYSTYNPPKTMLPRAFHSLNLPCILSSVTANYFWLVVALKIIGWQPPKVKDPPIHLSIFCHSI
jgi:hypothetical protein